MKNIAGATNNFIINPNQYQQCARMMFYPELHDSAPHLAIRISCKNNEHTDSKLLMEKFTFNA